MKSKLDYNPSLVAIFLDPDSQRFWALKKDWKLWDLCLEKLRSLFPDILIYANLDSNKDELLQNLSHPESLVIWENISTELDFLKKIGEVLPSSQSNDPDWDEVCFLYLTGISPLLDKNLSQESWERHKKYFSQYSYSENVPEGLIPRVISREFLASLPENLSGDIHSYFTKNINQYDVDIFFVPPDLRQYRLDFRVKNHRSLRLVKNFLQQSDSLVYDQIQPLIHKNPDWFRSAPSYIEWEISQSCEKKCSFCPRQYVELNQDGTFVKLVDVQQFLDKSNPELWEEITICLGGNGEPLLHPEWEKIVSLILERTQIAELIIETALYHQTERVFSFLETLNDKNKSRITFIINVTTLQKKKYEDLYGSGDLDAILNSVDRLRLLLPQESLYVQMIKMIEVKEEIENYFNFFEKKKIPVILQKFNTFASKIPEKRVSNLTPIHREFCWHLARDLYLNVNGDVSLCRQEPKVTIGNWINDTWDDLWSKGMTAFSHSLLGNHDKIPAPCLKCDEWYTFNA